MKPSNQNPVAVRIMLWRTCLFLALSVCTIAALWPQSFSISNAPSDVLTHAVAFCTLTFLASASFPMISGKAVFFFLALYGLALEGAQAFPVLERDASLRDWVVDLVAIVLTLAVIHIARRNNKRTSSQ